MNQPDSNLFATGADQSEIAYRVRTDGNGWRPYKCRYGVTAKASDAAKSGRSHFWLHEPGDGLSPIVAVDYWQRNTGRFGQYEHFNWYVSRIGQYQENRANDTGIPSGYRVRIDPYCDRLLMVQNAVVDGEGDLSFSSGEVKWFAPRKGKRGKTNYGLDGCGIDIANLSARPYSLPPSSAYTGRDYYDAQKWEPKWRNHPPWQTIYSNVESWAFITKGGNLCEARAEKVAEKHASGEDGGGAGCGRANDFLVQNMVENNADVIFGQEEFDKAMLYTVCEEEETYTEGGQEMTRKKFTPIWWVEVPSTNPKSTPEAYSPTILMDAMTRGADAYAGVADYENIPFFAEDITPNLMEQMTGGDFGGAVPGWVFDLCVKFKTYHYFAVRLDSNSRPIRGTEHRDYFNTMCFARFRLIAPVAT